MSQNLPRLNLPGVTEEPDELTRMTKRLDRMAEYWKHNNPRERAERIAELKRRQRHPGGLQNGA